MLKVCNDHDMLQSVNHIIIAHFRIVVNNNTNIRPPALHTNISFIYYRYTCIAIGWILFVVMFYRTFTMELESVEYDPYEILEISRVLSVSGSSVDHVIQLM